MKKITFLSFIFLFLASFSYAQEGKQKTVFGRPVKNISPSGHIRCATDEYEEFLQENDPKRMTKAQFEDWIGPLMQKQKELDMVSSQSGGIIYIPVVVHVIHNGDPYGVNENITDEQVQSQITVMTQDFRRLSGTPGFNTNAVGADTQIEFVLAKVDPNGNPTNGINRVNLCQDSWSTAAINSTVKPTTIWDATLYMNMWSVNFADNTLLGYAQFPSGSTLGGLAASGGAATTDGVVAGYRFFGSSSLATGNFQEPYDKGRTMTHEVGHFLGLIHIWGDNTSCTVNLADSQQDYCPDTPAAAEPNFGCVAGTNTCPVAAGNDMIENYMDYTDDACMNIFTINQKTRITTVMNNSPRRASLKTSTKDLPITLFANDAEVKIENYCSTTASACTPINQHKVLLYNRGTSNLTSATINYNVNGGANTPVNWTGTLAPNKYAEVTFTTTESTGTLNVSVATVNGGADARATNNTSSKAFTFSTTPPPTPPNFTSTAYTFNLTGDRYGSETTWSLKNAAGATLYSGGPYTDLTANGTQPLVVNQAWTLPVNGCYTFTINDAFADGICCTYGAGSYSITTGATSVATGGTFTTTEAKFFTNNSLSNQGFNSLSDVYVYPNPSNNILNISVSNNILPTSYEIFNTLGQKMDTKIVSSISDLSINTSRYSNGVYFITIMKDNERKTVQFIKE